jgi:hypothetical protein
VRNKDSKHMRAVTSISLFLLRIVLDRLKRYSFTLMIRVEESLRHFCLRLESKNDDKIKFLI